jgi:hypothetical protein
MDKNFQIQESRLEALEEQLKSLDRSLDSKLHELRLDCRQKISEEKFARMDSEYKMLKWVIYMIAIVILAIVIVF